MDEDYYFRIDEETNNDKLFVLIIYDITDNKMRNKFAKMLLGYGFRIQKSAFEAVINKTKFIKLKKEIPKYINEKDDSVKVYQIRGTGNIYSWGKNEEYTIEDIIVI